jgi:hypothetical protein
MAPPYVDALDSVLSGLGAKADRKLRDRLDAEAGEQPELSVEGVSAQLLGTPGSPPPPITRGGTGLRSTGPYEVHGAWRKGDVTVIVEQNTDQAGVHEPVAVVEGPNYRSACDPTDHDLLAAEVAAAAGDFSRHETRAARAALAAAGFTEDRASPGTYVRNGLKVTGLLLATLPSLLLGRLLPLSWLLPPSVVTNATKKALLDAWYSAASIGAPATHHFGLSTSTPAEDGTNVTEPSGNGYARVAKTANSTEFPLSTAADPTVKTNGTTITWPAATGSWGTVTHCTQHDAATAGNVKDWQALGASQAISNGTTASIAASSWQSTLT